MHDRNGTALKVGDVVSIEFEINSVSPGEDYCNVSARSVLGRKPDGQKEYFSGNAAVCTLQRRAPEVAVDEPDRTTDGA
ncbi:MAG: hypothetical protein ACRDK7_10070 [Solirubrobacteraceae bacterium]